VIRAAGVGGLLSTLPRPRTAAGCRVFVGRLLVSFSLPMRCTFRGTHANSLGLAHSCPWLYVRDFYEFTRCGSADYSAEGQLRYRQ